MPDDQDYTAPREEHEVDAEEGVRDAEAVASFYLTLTRKSVDRAEALAMTLKYIEFRGVAKAKLQIQLPPESPDESEDWKG